MINLTDREYKESINITKAKDYEDAKNMIDKANLPLFFTLDMIKSYGPAVLNRNRSGMQKSVMVGGSERQVISSQALNRVIREQMADAVFLRTKTGHLAVADKIIDDAKENNENVSNEQINYAMFIAAMIMYQDDKATPKETKSLDVGDSYNAFRSKTSDPYSARDIETFAGIVKKALKNQDAIAETDKAIESAKKAFEKGGKSKTVKLTIGEKTVKYVTEAKAYIKTRKIDIAQAFFGSFATSVTCETVESAVKKGIAYSITPYQSAQNDWTAVNTFFPKSDSLKPLMRDGADNINTSYISANTFYEKAKVDMRCALLNMLKNADFNNKDAVRKDVEDAAEYLAYYIWCFAFAVPSGGQHTAYTSSLPDALAVRTARSPQTDMALDNEFFIPVKPSEKADTVKEGIRRMKEGLENAPDGFYGIDENRKKFWCGPADAVPEGFECYSIKHLKKLTEEIREDLCHALLND